MAEGKRGSGLAEVDQRCARSALLQRADALGVVRAEGAQEKQASSHRCQRPVPKGHRCCDVARGEQHRERLQSCARVLMAAQTFFWIWAKPGGPCSREACTENIH